MTPFGKALIALALLAAPALAQETGPPPIFASVGTGATNGVYYPVGAGICALVNGSIRTTGVRCSQETTPGSVYNIDGLRSGELEFAIVQSDVALDAFKGRGAFDGRSFPQLRSVFALHPELVTVIARVGVKDLRDLAGKALYAGPEGSGTRSTWAAIDGALAWAPDRKPRLVTMPEDAVGSALCSGSLDAAMLMVGHPSRKVADILKRCPLTLVAVDDPRIDAMIAATPSLRKGAIDATAYGATGSTTSFGVDAVLMTTSGMDARAVTAFAKGVVGQIDALKAKHPALAHLSVADMVSGALPAPLHPAAAEAYKDLTPAK